MALSCSSLLCRSRNPYFCCKLNAVQLLPHARSQNFGDENEGNAVDANMRVLRCRIERVRMRERLKKDGNGWNYRSQKDDVQKIKMQSFLITSFQLANIVCINIGLVFLTGSLCIFLVSFIFSSSID